jgi:hypothetical protein
MKQQIVRIGPHSAGRVVGLLYLALGLFLVEPMLLFLAIEHPQEGWHVFMFAIPLVYAVGGYLFAALSAWIYNLVARLAGGLEITATPDDGHEAPVAR